MYIQYILHGGTLQKTEKGLQFEYSALEPSLYKVFAACSSATSSTSVFLCLVLCLLPCRAFKPTLNGALE